MSWSEATKKCARFGKNLWIRVTKVDEVIQHIPHIRHSRRPHNIADMGILENEAQQERRKNYLQRALLVAVGISGLMLVGAIAPNVSQIIRKAGRNKYKFSYQVKSVATRLAQKGLVRFIDRGGKKYLEITEKGRRILELEQQEAALKQRVRRRWDKRWRMVAFDIPERYRTTRNKLRTTLRALGFMQLQGSVWVYPYDCEEIITLLKSDLRLGGMALYSIVEKIENDARLKRHFKLR